MTELEMESLNLVQNEIRSAARAEAEQLRERVRVLEDAVEMVLLYHSASPWDDAKTKRWERWTGRDEATTKALCDQLRTLRRAALNPKAEEVGR